MKMDIYKSGAEVNIHQDMMDYDGQTIYPDSASYRVEDEDGVEIVADTAITYDPDDTDVQLVIDAAHNTLAVDDWTKMRVVIITFVLDGHDFTFTHRYIVRQGERLSEWDNSFQTYNSAVMKAFDVTSTEGWDYSSEENRQTALIEAFENIGMLRFSGSAIWSSEDSITTVGGLYGANSDIQLGSLTTDEINELPSHFIETLKKAQVVEADFLLGGITVEDKRRSGLMSETIGESSAMFRPGKPLIFPVSNRTLRVLTGYLSNTRVISRG